MSRFEAVSRRRCSGTIGFLTALVILGFTGESSRLLADNWPEWRGPTGQGVSAETSAPVSWSRTQNVRWRARLPERGNSTPVVFGERVFLTQATTADSMRWTMCFERATGALQWKRGVEYSKDEPTHKTNPYCSGSPATDGERVISHYGSAGVSCYSVEGRELWHRDLGEFRHVWGNSSSPVIRGDRCFINCGPGPQTFLIALDVMTGDTLWKTDIPGGLEAGDRDTWTGSWSTPTYVREGERDTLLIGYPHRLLALDPSSGEERWRCEGLGNLVYTSVITAGDVAYANSGFNGPPLAVRMGGRGDVTTSHRLWREEKGPQRIGSGVIQDGHVYIVNDNGIAECFELESGQRRWRHRLGTQTWSSTVLCAGNVYSLDSDGTCFVFKANSERFESVATNVLGERSRSSIVISDGQVFVRTYEHLWCVDARGP